MNKFALSLLSLVLLSACVARPTDLDPELQPVNNAQLTKAIMGHESYLIDELSKKNERLNQSNQELILALQQELRTLKDYLSNTSKTHVETMNIQHNDATVYPENETQDGKMIVGEQEIIWLDAAESEFSARIDTGATTSSLNANKINVFERDGDPWVSFDIPLFDSEQVVSLELPIVRQVRIRQVSADEIDNRPVVELTLRLGTHIEKTEFTLADRSKMKHPVLLGREFLKDIAVVDIARQNAQGTPSRPLAKD